MHEVKREPTRRRYAVDIEAESDEAGEGTPRVQRTFSQPQEVMFPTRPRRISAKGKERADDRETSPASTAAGEESSEDSGVWEDTSSEGADDREPIGDDGEKVPPEDDISPFKVSCDVHPSQETLRVV